jgi:hypothetical protein
MAFHRQPVGQDGHHDLVDGAKRFVDRMPAAKTERERLA